MKEILRKILFMVCVVTLAGCSTIDIPQYIQDKYPYQKTLYKSFDKTLEATRQALTDLGWTIDKEVQPSIYERNRVVEEGEGQATLIFTDVRRTPFILGTRYAHLNIYLRGGEKVTEVEIRYLTLNSLAFKTFRHYKNDAATERIFKKIEENLE